MIEYNFPHNTHAYEVTRSQTCIKSCAVWKAKADCLFSYTYMYLCLSYQTIFFLEK